MLPSFRMGPLEIAMVWLVGILGLQLVPDRTSPLLLILGWFLGGCLVAQGLDICHLFGTSGLERMVEAAPAGIVHSYAVLGAT